MNHLFKKALQTNNSLKIFATITGLLFWTMLSQSQKITVTLPVTLKIHHSSPSVIVHGPRQVYATLQGKRTELKRALTSGIFAHLDDMALQKGTHAIELTEKHLVLPQSIKVVSYSPHTLLMTKVIAT